MSFQDLEAGRPLNTRRVGYTNGFKQQDPTQAFASGIFQINTAVNSFQRLVKTLGTPKDTHELREKLHKSRLHIGQLVKDTSEKLKQASETDHHAEVSVSKKITDAKLAKDFQAALKEFQKAQRLAAERETAYTPSVTKQNLSDSLKISLKLNNQNYALWTRMIRVAIGGKSKALLNHLSTNPPNLTSEEYEQWEQDDLVVFSWLIQNIEPTLASNLTEFPTAKSLWDALAITYSSGRDKLQTFNLHVKANEVKQNGVPLEEFWIVMQGIWGEIERIDPNPMTCASDINTYTKIRSEQKLFQFLNALDRKYDHIKREVLRMDPLPSPEGAYATVRKEAAHQKILGSVSDNTPQQGVVAGLVTVEPREPIGAGLAAKGQRYSSGRLAGTMPKPDKSHLKCSHCGLSKHTKEQCFKIVGYPEWWNDGHKQGQAAATVGSSTGAAQQVTGGTGFGGMADAKGEEDAVTGYQDGSDHWAWH